MRRWSQVSTNPFNQVMWHFTLALHAMLASGGSAVFEFDDVA